jgi:hypothetical protein
VEFQPDGFVVSADYIAKFHTDGIAKFQSDSVADFQPSAMSFSNCIDEFYPDDFQPISLIA